MKNILICILILSTSLFATQARVESMGKRSAFFLDDVSIFENPANATFYSRSLIGELGFYQQNSLGPQDVGYSKDPFTPWFGALFKYGLSEGGTRDPQITFGGVFGREHYNFTRFVPRKVVVDGDTVAVPQTITNFDAFLAGTMMDGSAIGAHVYVGIQEGKQDHASADPAQGTIAPNAHVSILSMDYGANFLITNNTSIELTFGIARIQYGPSRRTFLDPGLFSFYSQGRTFLDVNAIGGQFVTGYKLAKMEVPGWQEKYYGLNTGLNVAISRGFLWIGIDGILIEETVGTWDKETKEGETYFVYREPGSHEIFSTDNARRFGGIVSFGIERNVLGKWLTIRAGAQKSFMYNECTKNSERTNICPDRIDGHIGQSGNFWSTNVYSDGTLDDNIGFGIGLNIDNKLKIDAALAEDILFRNPFQGTGRLVSRISAIYTF
ncbi:MAG: hypothetical protein FWC15_02365 [Fibromonadales bacterium]|nr:hypothetical protein [Fibromonadales bacterium]